MARLLARRRRAQPVTGGCTSASPRRRASTSTSSGAPASRPGTATTARPARGPVPADYYGGVPARSGRQQRRGGAPRRGAATAAIDHLWIRVADLAAAKRFYEAIAPHAGSTGRRQARARAVPRQRAVRSRSCRATPTEHVHLAFPAPDDATSTLPRGAAEAGYRDNGAPGRAAAVPPRLLRRVRARSRRQQHRGRQPQPLRGQPSCSRCTRTTPRTRVSTAHRRAACSGNASAAGRPGSASQASGARRGKSDSSKATLARS